jgi:hypothetical protein
MTSANNPAGLPLAAGEAADSVDTDETRAGGPTVGSDDAAADAERSGADVDMDGAVRDTDGVPVGSDDADEDARRSGATD